MRFYKILAVVVLLVIAILAVRNSLNAMTPGMYVAEDNTSRIELRKDGSCFVEEQVLSSSGKMESVRMLVGRWTSKGDEIRIVDSDGVVSIGWRSEKIFLDFQGRLYQLAEK